MRNRRLFVADHRFRGGGWGATIVVFTTEAFFLRVGGFGEAGFLAEGLETAFTAFFFVGELVFVIFPTGFLGVPVFFAETLIEEAGLAFVGSNFLATTGFFVEGPLGEVFFFPNAVPVFPGFFVAADLEATVFFMGTDGFLEEGFEVPRRTDFF